MPEIILKGCTPEPLMNYLKALGVLRLVAEDRKHGDPNARGCWRNDVFVLCSPLDENALETLFLKHYRPTPLLAPWNGGSGFYLKWDEKSSKFKEREAETTVTALRESTSNRFAEYRAELRRVYNALREQGELVEPQKQIEEVRQRAKLEKWPEMKVNKELKALFDSQMLLRHDQGVLAMKKADKDALVADVRSNLVGDAALLWLDSAFVVRVGQKKNRIESPLLGSGGNIGNSEFSVRFMQMLQNTLPLADDADPPPTSPALLRSALSGSPTSGLDATAVDQFHPGHAGGANMGQCMEAGFRLNPWDYILMLEGCVMLQGAASRRLGSSESSAAFPFAVDSSSVGFTSAGSDTTRGEQWLPLWSRACTAGEIRHLLAEGRVDGRGRGAESAVEFARAAATLGIDRGVSEFVRVQYQARFGDNYLANALGRVRVTEQPNADLLREIDPWLDRFRRAVDTSGNKPENRLKRFVASLRAIDAAVFDFCRYGGPNNFQSILIALGAAEREMALTPGKIGQSKTIVQPLSGLSSAWIDAANAPDKGEFEIALALAGIRHEPEREQEGPKYGPIRVNLEPVEWTKRWPQWAEKDRAVVWNAADLSANLAAVLDRRVMDGGRKGCADLPLASPSAASPASIAAFLRGALDDRKIEDLLWGLMLIDRCSALPGADADDVLPPALPPLYALLKLLFLPRPLLASCGATGTVRWRFANANENGVRIRPEPAILSLLRAGRVGEAAAIAMRRLRASGLTPLPHRRSGGPSRDGEWSEVRLSPREGKRLAAALLIPIRADAVNALVQQATRADMFDEPSEATTAIAVQ